MLDSDDNFKIIVVGNAKVGKTVLIRNLLGETFKDKYDATIGVDFAVLRRGAIKFNIWDIAGQDRFKNISGVYYKSTDIIIYALDSTEDANENKIILKNLQDEISRICPVSNCFQIIVFTKSDDNDSKISKFYLEKFESFKVPIIVTSAKNGIGFTEINERLLYCSQFSTTTKLTIEKQALLVSAIENYSKSLNKKDSQLAKNKSKALDAIVKACRNEGMGQFPAQSNVNYLSGEQISKIKEVIKENKAIITQHRHSSCFSWFFNLFDPSRLAKRVTSNELVNKLEVYLNHSEDNVGTIRPR